MVESLGEEPDHDVVVVGAGAAGLWAAARAAELGREVLLLEKTSRAGTKVLASGGTRCNLTTTLGPDAAAREFGPRAERFLRRAFRALPPSAVRAHFEELGVPTRSEAWDKVFPASGRARDVRDALAAWGRGAGARLCTEAPVVAVEPVGGGVRLRLAGGRKLVAREVVLAAGGKSYPRTGTTGDAYGWLADLGLELVPPVPALVPLTSPAPWVRALAGIALQEVAVRLVGPDGRRLGARRRPLLFTHRGLSGPAAMDLSLSVARAVESTPETAPRPTFTLEVDLLPDLSREDLRAALVAGAGRPGAPGLEGLVAHGLGAPLPRRVARAFLDSLGLAGRRTNEVSRAERHRLVEGLKGWALPVDGTLGFERAEVTAGGLALGQVDPGSGRVRGIGGLLVCGELLDLAGPIGGLNFQAAFATAETAARGLA